MKKTVVVTLSAISIAAGVTMISAGLHGKMEMKRDITFTVITPSTKMTGTVPLPNTGLHRRAIDC